MFMLIIWLQGIWLPLHGYDFTRTPLWAGIAMLPLTAGFLIAGPMSGVLSDRYGARPFTTGGMLGAAVCFALLELLPVDFTYWVFGLLLFITGLSMASFGSPNRAGVMNSLPPEHRGAGSGMNTTFQNSAQVLSIGIFFTLMIVGLSPAAHAPVPGAGGPRRAIGGRRPGVASATGLHALRRLPGLQPGPAPGGATSWPSLRATQQAGSPAAASSPASSPAFPVRAPRRARLRHRGQSVGRRGVMVSRQAHGAAPGCVRAPRYPSGHRARARAGQRGHTAR